MYCIKCGNKLNENDKFCTKCGASKKFPPGNTESNGIGLLLSILSLLLCLCPIISIPLAIAGIILSKKDKSNKKTINIISIISIIISIIMIILLVLIILVSSNFITSTTNKIEEVIENIPEENQTLEQKLFEKKWQGTDSSVLYLEENKTYQWYSNTKTTDNYDQGTYEIYTGYNAIEYIAKNLDEYSIPEEEQLKLFFNNIDNIDNYLLLVLKSNSYNYLGEETPFQGFYDNENKSLTLVNLKNSNNIEFKLIEDNQTNKEGIV